MKRNGQLLGFSLIVLAGISAGCSAGNSDGQVSKQIGEALCSDVSVTSDHPSQAAVTGSTVVWTASPTCSGTPEYEFWFQNPSTGVWAITQAWGASNTFSWNTAGLPTGSWNMQVWARDAPSGNWFQAYVGAPFTLTSSPACSSETTTVNPNPVIAGASAVTFTNSAATCGSPEFLVYHQAPGQPYQIDSQYSAANSSYVWDTTGAASGTHWFQIRARSQGSTVAYDAYSTVSVTVLGATPCTGVTMDFSPTSQATVGTQVNVTASASGCQAPTYEYWYQPPGGSWSILQSYTSSPNLVWNTTLATAGSYNLQVWARAAGSPQQNETYVGHSYTLIASAPTTGLAIGGGYGHNCVLLGSGKVGCWGYDNEGELGNGTISNGAVTPVAVTGITNAIAFSAGDYHNCAVVVGGGVKCWGLNNNGQLGNGTYTDSTTPVAVSSIASAVSVNAGVAHTCAVLADGTAQCWGYNTQGQLGDGTISGKNSPVTVAGVSNIKSVSTGYYHSCALLNDGTVRCWGRNNVGQLGNGTVVNSLSPVTVTGLSGVTSLATYSNSTCAVKTDGTIWCWGSNGTATGGAGAPQSTALQVSGVSSAKSMDMGAFHACAGLQDGTAACWGYNLYGQLGNGTNTDSSTPVAVSGLTNVATIGASRMTSCALITDGTYKCWGYGNPGSLGNGATADSNIPVAVTPVP